VRPELPTRSAAPDLKATGALAQSAELIRAIRVSPGRSRLGLLLAGIVAVICLTVLGQIKLNAWYEPFYDALAQRHAAAFSRQLLIFVGIVGVLLTLNVAQNWLQEMMKVRLREWLTRDLLDQWLVRGRAFRIASAGEIGVNPDQRVQEDIRHLTELWADLGIGFVQSFLLLVSFVGVLWILSSEVVLTFGARSITLSGYMVWSALFYSAAGSWLSWRVGRPLIGLNAERYAREAEFRFALVRLSEHADGISLYGGEEDERRRIEGQLVPVVTIMRHLVGAAVRLTWITAGYGWAAIAFPFLVAAPAYFGGQLSFGELMMAVGAFQQVQQSLRWFVENFGRIADWRATLRRVMSFRQALVGLEPSGLETRGIRYQENSSEGFLFDDLQVDFGSSSATLLERHVEIAPGERVLILGRPGSGKSTLFRAIAGLWPWGCGTIRVPRRDSVLFLPQRPYLPLGSLRAALTYPASPTSISSDAVSTALERIGLGYLSESLDRIDRWDKELGSDEQQRIAFARALLHKPRWILLDEAIDALAEDDRGMVLSIFDKELAGTGVISIGRHPARNGFYTRTLHLIRETARPSGRPSPNPPTFHPETPILRPPSDPVAKVG
jgi:putative ATP-binding cassette transporter